MDIFNFKFKSWCTKKRANFVFLSVMTWNVSVYSVAMGSSRGWVINLSPIVMVADGSISLIVVNILRYLTGRFTVFSESEVPNSMVNGVVYLLLRKFTSTSCVMIHS